MTLTEIKQRVAVEEGYYSWKEAISLDGLTIDMVDKIAEFVWEEACRQTELEKELGIDYIRPQLIK